MAIMPGMIWTDLPTLPGRASDVASSASGLFRRREKENGRRCKPGF